MSSYTPQPGHKVIVGSEELGPQVQIITEMAPDASWIGVIAEPLYVADDRFRTLNYDVAERDAQDMYRLQGSGQLVFLLDPQLRPERRGIGFVIPTDEPVEEWYMDAEEEPGVAFGFLHSEQTEGVAHQQHDGTWVMNEIHPVFFISATQADMYLGNEPEEENTAG